jgi:hypothetical protein
MTERIAITGGPRTGKTTLAKTFVERGYRLKHTDDLINGWDWNEASHQASFWFSLPGPLCIEGVSVPRALRKWMKRNDGKPLDRLVVLQGPMVKLTPGQETMAKGIDTVLNEILPILRSRGVSIEFLEPGKRIIETVQTGPA